MGFQEKLQNATYVSEIEYRLLNSGQQPNLKPWIYLDIESLLSTLYLLSQN